MENHFKVQNIKKRFPQLYFFGIQTERQRKSVMNDQQDIEVMYESQVIKVR